MRALSIAATGMLAQQTNVEVIANNLANMNTSGLQDAARRIPGSALSEYRAGRRAVVRFRHRHPFGHSAWRRCAHGRCLSRDRPGRPAVDLQPLRHGDSGFGLFPHSAARRHRRLHARRQFRAVAGRPDRHRQGLYRGAGHRRSAATRSASRSMRKVRCRRQLPGQTAPQTLGQLELTRFPNEAGLSAQGGNLYLETPSSGSPQSGVPGSAGYGTISRAFSKPPTSIRWKRSPR